MSNQLTPEQKEKARFYIELIEPVAKYVIDTYNVKVSKKLEAQKKKKKEASKR